MIGTNVAMFITGRLLTGWSSGMILPVSAIYMAEVSKPQSRGIVVGFQGMGTASGFFLANWIGYSGIFFEGNLQWRFPLSLQFPCAVLMLVGSLVVLPFTPRWLVSQDRFEEARAVLARIHSDEGEEFIDQEMIQIREQTALERSYKRVGGEKWYSNFLMLFTRQYIKRLGFVCFIQALTQFGGVTVIREYKPSLIFVRKVPRCPYFGHCQNVKGLKQATNARTRKLSEYLLRDSRLHRRHRAAHQWHLRHNGPRGPDHKPRRRSRYVKPPSSQRP